MLKNPNFPGLCPETHWGSLLESLHCSPDLLAGGKETRCPIPNNPTPVLGPAIRPRFYGFQGLTHDSVVRLSTINIIGLLLIHNNAYSYLLLLYF